MLFEVSEAAKGQTHGSLFSIFTGSFIQTNGPFISWYFLDPGLLVLSSHCSQDDGRKQSYNYHKEIYPAVASADTAPFPSCCKCVRLPATFFLIQWATKATHWAVISLLRSVICEAFTPSYSGHKRCAHNLMPPEASWTFQVAASTFSFFLSFFWLVQNTY